MTCAFTLESVINKEKSYLDYFTKCCFFSGEKFVKKIFFRCVFDGAFSVMQRLSADMRRNRAK